MAIVLLFLKSIYALISDSYENILGNFTDIKYDSIQEFPPLKSSSFEFSFELVLRYSFNALVLYLLWLVYKIGFSPLNRIKDSTEVGFSHLVQNGVKKQNLAMKLKEIQRLRKTGKLPPVYPNGWFAIAESRDIRVCEVKSVQCLGETFAVYRGENGIINVVDGICPHLGANMGVGGTVKGDCLECPFHGWAFSGKDGSCTSIPYAKKIPEFAKVKKWPSAECNGFVFVWYHAEGLKPQWEIPPYNEIQNGNFAYRGRTEHHVLAHIQEIPENGADIEHLNYLHTPNVLKGAELIKIYTSNKLFDIFKHDWNGVWSQKEAPDEHIAEVTIHHSYTICGNKFNLLEMTITAHQIGPAIVALHFDTLMGRGILIQTVTPEEPLRQKLVHHFYSSPGFIAPLSKLVLLGEANHVERDITIWNNKKYLSKPLLVAEDKLIARFRRWYSQFYSENSPKFESFQRENLDW